jgi:hypothetical protein
VWHLPAHPLKGALAVTLRAKLQPADRWVRGAVFDPYAEQSLREHYDGTPASVQLLAQRLRVSRPQIHEWAHRLGLTRQLQGRNTWRADELAYLEAHWGEQSARAIGAHLRRRPTSVTAKAHKLRLRLVGGGFTQEQVAEGFGVSRATVERWRARGWLGRYDQRLNHGRICDISAETLRAFVRAHPLAFDVRRCDQVWFITLVLGVPPRLMGPQVTAGTARYAIHQQRAAVALTEQDLRY